MRRGIKKLLYFAHSKYHHLFGILNNILPERIEIYPSLLRIRITSKCNLHCGFCYLSGSLNQKEEGVLNDSEWVSILERLPRYTIVDITGAEPTLSKSFSKVLSTLLDKGHKVSLTTNGMDTSDEFVNLIVDKGLFYLMISVDDLPEQHDLIRGHKKSSENIAILLDKIEQRKKEKGLTFPIINFKTTILDDNLEKLDEIHSYYQERFSPGSHSFNLGFQNVARGGIINDGALEETLKRGNEFIYKKAPEVQEDSSSINTFLFLRGSEIQIRPSLNSSDVKEYIQRPSSFGVRKCSMLNSVLTLNFDGGVSFCDINNNITNIRDINYDLKKVWSLPRFKEVSQKIESTFPFSPACEGCCLAPHERKFS